MFILFWESSADEIKLPGLPIFSFFYNYAAGVNYEEPAELPERAATWNLTGTDRPLLLCPDDLSCGFLGSEDLFA